MCTRGSRGPFCLLEICGGFGDLNGWEWGTIKSLMTASRRLCGCRGVGMFDHILGWLITAVFSRL